MDKIRETVKSMQRAMASLSNAVVEMNEEEGQKIDMKDQLISSLEEQNKLLSAKNRRLSVANQRISLLNTKLIREKNSQQGQISESSKKLEESNALVIKLENEIDSLKTASIMVGLKFKIINIEQLS